MDKKSILVIEDERPLLNAIRTKLENSGFEVVTARTVDQALSYLQDIPGIRGVWLDHYLLGKRTGLDFVVEVKGHELWKKIPIFVVSNTASPENIHSYIHFGVDKYYTKADFRLDQIIADMQNIIK